MYLNLLNQNLSGVYEPLECFRNPGMGWVVLIMVSSYLYNILYQCTVILLSSSDVGREVPIHAISRWYLRDLVIKRSRAHLEIAQTISRWSCSN